MKNKKTNINFFSIAVILSTILGLNGCNTQHDRTPQIRVQDFVKKEVVDGNLAFRHKVTKEKMEVIICGPKYKTKCPSPNNGFKPIGSQEYKVTVTAFQKKSKSVDCFILMEITGYQPLKLTWHEEGDTCSAGQPVL